MLTFSKVKVEFIGVYFLQVFAPPIAICTSSHPSTGHPGSLDVRHSLVDRLLVYSGQVADAPDLGTDRLSAELHIRRNVDVTHCEDLRGVLQNKSRVNLDDRWISII